MSGAGVSVVIPFGGAARLPLLAATLASLGAAAQVDQVIVAEYGTTPLAVAAAAAAGADHVFLPGAPPFDKVRAINAGTALATRPDILWCDGDLLLCRDFIPRALAECRAGGFDFFFPYATIDYLGEADSVAVLAGERAPAACPAQRTLSPLYGGAPGGMGLVRRDFLDRHGGMIEGFRGWGMEDSAWVHKARLLGRVGVSARRDQRLWHLFHPDSGSHSNAAAEAVVRANPGYAGNGALAARIHAVDDGAELRRQFPPPAHDTPPWPAGLSLLFVVAGTSGSLAARRAAGWAARIGAHYGAAPALVITEGPGLAATLRENPAALVAGFADTVAGRDALAAALGERPAVIVPAPGDRAASPPPSRGNIVILPSSAAQCAQWGARGFRVWHRPWREHAACGLPAIVQPLSQLAAPRCWDIRIVLDRAALAPRALDQPRLWYVGMHDNAGTELLRADADQREIARTLAAGEGPIVIARRVEAPCPPASWTVWPIDRHGYWLDRIVGPVDASCLVLS